MSTPGSVTGPDRRPVTDATRRGAAARPGEGAEEFGTALSAELSRPGTDWDRLSQDRYARNQAAQYGNAQAQAVILFVIVAFISVLQAYFTQKREVQM